MKQISIRSHVAWLTLVPSLILVVCLGAFSLYGRFAEIDRNLLERAELVVRQLASSSEYGVFSNNRPFLQNIAVNTLKQPDVKGVAILNASSEILVKTGELSDYNNSENEMGVPAHIHAHKHSLLIRQPIIPVQLALDELGGKSVVQPIGAVIVEIDRLRSEKIKTEALWITVLGMSLLLGIASLLVYLASRSITHPIRRLSEAVHSIGHGNLETRVSLKTNINELNTLAQGLNKMAADLQQERNILEQRIEEATRALRAKKEGAERASHDKSRFLAVASHDLRQPLHALSLYVAELQQRSSGDDSVRKIISQVDQSVESLSILLNALLDISKLDANVVVPQIQPCSLKSILQHIETDYQMLAGIKNTRLIVRSCNGYITTDPQLLERVLTNLVSNAIRYTPSNGCVMIACRRRGDYWRIEVRDNGVGITEIDQINIFREFFRLPNPQVNMENGLGLGLSIVDRLVKLLGHTLKLRSAPGKGSVFALYVPAVANKVAAEELEELQSEESHEIKTLPLAGVKLLIVDDDPVVLSSTSSLMNSWGCNVSSAGSPAEVKQLMKKGEAWDFIISDYQLSEDNAMSGIDVIAAVRRHQGREVPCILISGDTSQAVLKLASVNGYHLLYKPVKPAKLKSLILHLLNEPESGKGATDGKQAGT